MPQHCPWAVPPDPHPARTLCGRRASFAASSLARGATSAIMLLSALPNTTKFHTLCAQSHTPPTPARAGSISLLQGTGGTRQRCTNFVWTQGEARGAEFYPFVVDQRCGLFRRGGFVGFWGTRLEHLGDAQRHPSGVTALKTHRVDREESWRSAKARLREGRGGRPCEAVHSSKRRSNSWQRARWGHFSLSRAI